MASQRTTKKINRPLAPGRKTPRRVLKEGLDTTAGCAPIGFVFIADWYPNASGMALATGEPYRVVEGPECKCKETCDPTRTVLLKVQRIPEPGKPDTEPRDWAVPHDTPLMGPPVDEEPF